MMFYLQEAQGNLKNDTHTLEEKNHEEQQAE